MARSWRSPGTVSWSGTCTPGGADPPGDARGGSTGSPSRRTGRASRPPAGALCKSGTPEAGAGRDARTARHVKESVAFSPDGRILAWVGHDGIVHLKDRVSGVSHGIPSGQGRGRLWCVAFSPDGRGLATTSADGTVRLWDSSAIERRSRSGSPRGSGSASASSRDGARFVAAGAGGDVLDPRRPDRLPPGRKGFGTPGQVVSSSLTGDAGRLTTLDRAGVIAIWDVETGRCLRESRTTRRVRPGRTSSEGPGSPNIPTRAGSRSATRRAVPQRHLAGLGR